MRGAASVQRAVSPGGQSGAERQRAPVPAVRGDDEQYSGPRNIAMRRVYRGLNLVRRDFLKIESLLKENCGRYKFDIDGKTFISCEDIAVVKEADAFNKITIETCDPFFTIDISKRSVVVFAFYDSVHDAGIFYKITEHLNARRGWLSAFRDELYQSILNTTVVATLVVVLLINQLVGSLNSASYLSINLGFFGPAIAFLVFGWIFLRNKINVLENKPEHKALGSLVSGIIIALFSTAASVGFEHLVTAYPDLGQQVATLLHKVGL